MNPVDYMKSRVGSVILTSDKVWNEGCRLLASYPLWEYEIDRLVDESWDTLLRYCVRNKNATYSASVKLTFTSDLIGKRICRNIGIDETKIKSSLALGDLMLESFLQDDLIEIFREYDSPKAPYIVRVVNQTDDMKPLLIGTVFEAPRPIAGLRSGVTGDPFIKGWTNAKLFHEYMESPFIRALETLRQQPWELNIPVLDAMKANPPQESLTLVDEDGVIYEWNIHNDNKHAPKKLSFMDTTKFLGKRDPKLQRLISKYFEYTQIMRKADLVVDNGNLFYQEVSCDYRGRIYYAESFLEFQGNDSARSLFLFANKKRVTEEGLRWMYIHAGNSYNMSYSIDQLADMPWLKENYMVYLMDEGLDTISVDKMTLDDRCEWGKRFMDKWDGSFCPEAEKPYAFYAVCLDIQGYKESEGNYLSGLPIPIDGSNNGWQHLAAISKDKSAGELVSLTPSKIQKDFYVAVAKELINIIPDWFKDKNIPMKHIRKGIAKRGAMTRAYSAGKKRIAKNMYEDCHMEGFTAKYNITEDDCVMLAGNLIRAINSVCAGPLKTTKYLQKIAEHELSQGRNQLTWVTPSGFPVIYKAYLQHERKQRGTIRGIKGNKDGRVMHVVRVDVLSRETGERVPCRRSFASGVAPNVVHSLDAAHMSNCINAFNGSFAAVHDSFSCHADEIPFLQEVTKMTFVSQYNVPNFFGILEDLIMEHQDSFTYPQPSLGKLKVQDVEKSDYFFC